MSTMNNGTSWNDAVTINKQSGTKITLDTDSKFVAKDIELTINVQGGSATTPNTTITANPTLSINSSTGVVTGTVSATKSVTPTVNAGYVSTGSAGTMTVSGSKTLSLTTQAAQTITPGTTNKTIASGRYLTGKQTIKGDSNLVAANIAEGVSIFGVTGTHSSGIDTSDATATANDILNNKTAYVDGSKITGNIPSKSSSNLTVSGATVTAPAGYYPTAATKTIDSGSTTQNAPTINSSTGLVTATATVTAGYQGASTKSNTLQLTTQAAQTITPGTTNQTIAAGKYLTGAQTIAGDENLVSGNIAEGVSIFGVTGTYSGGTDTTDATATANDILSGKTAYVNGIKISGNIAIYEPPVLPYAVTISLTNPISTNSFRYCNIYEAQTDDFETAISTQPIGTIDSYTGSVSLSVSAFAYGIVIDVGGGDYMSNPAITCNGGVSYTDISNEGDNILVMCPIAGDGSITLDSINYDPLSSHNVTVSLTNPSNHLSFRYCNIYEVQTDNFSSMSAQPIGTINSSTGSVSVSVPASVYGIVIDVGGGPIRVVPNPTCTGYTSYIKRMDGQDNNTSIMCSITGDGTITLDGINYNDR